MDGQKNKLCAKTENECKIYNEMNKILDLNSFQPLSLMSYIWQSSELKRKMFAQKFHTIMSKVKNCHNDIFKPKDICLIKRHCFKANKVEKLETKLNLSNTFVRINCECSEDYTYFCDQNYCSKDYRSCEAFHLKYKLLTRSASAMIGINSCDNNIFSFNK